LKRWYAAQIMAGWRHVAEKNLGRQDYESFSPVVIRRDGGNGPMFPGYIFVAFDIEVCAWRSVNGTIGVVGLLPRWAEIPTPLRDGVVESLIEAGPLPMEMLGDMVDRFAMGEEVEVVDGALVGVRGTVSGYRGKFVDVLLAAMFDRTTPAIVPEGMVRRVS
jgi:transcriptional antiterminator RfaH